VFDKKTRKTPKRRLDEARRRLAAYYAALEED
jgi:phage-related protein